MRIIKIGEKAVNLYDSIEELPAALHNEFNIAIIENNGIGYGLAAIKNHNQKILEFLTMNQTEYALEQAKNQNFCIINTENNYNPNRSAFCFLIHSIDSVEPHSRTPEYLDDLVSQVSDEEINRIVDEVKKKLMMN